MLVGYDDSKLGPYSPITLSSFGPYSPITLSALGATSPYDNLPTKSGMTYRIWLSLPPQDPNVWTTKYNNRDTCDSYMAMFNGMTPKKFTITKKPTVDNVNGVIYLEGKATASYTWSQINIPGAWNFLYPWYVGAGLFRQSWRGIKNVAYSKILDSSGRDVSQTYESPTPTLPTQPTAVATETPTGGMPTLFGINILWIGAAVAVVGGAVLLARKTRSSNA